MVRYMEGEQGYLRFVLSGDDPQRIARGLVYQTYLARAQADLIQRTHEDLARLAGVESAAREKAGELAGVEKKRARSATAWWPGPPSAGRSWRATPT
jgi:septal ring factor EnvC (AmiA/AmiB activator)